MKELGDFLVIIPFEIGLAFVLVFFCSSTGILHLKEEIIKRLLTGLGVAWYISMILISLIQSNTDMLICLIFIVIFSCCFSFALYLVNRKDENEDGSFIVCIISLIILLNFLFFI